MNFCLFKFLWNLRLGKHKEQKIYVVKFLTFLSDWRQVGYNGNFIQLRLIALKNRMYQIWTPLFVSSYFKVNLFQPDM